MTLYGVIGLAAASLLAGCSGIVENRLSPDRIQVGDFQKAGSLVAHA